MKVAIFGSRDYPDLAGVGRYVRALPPDTTVYTGGARGVDRFAEHVARQCGLSVVVRVAEWDRYGRQAGIIRTDAMLRELKRDRGRVVFFWDSHSPGTRFGIARAQELELPVVVITAQVS